ncbi:MAG: hypothetical protein AB1454_13035 [Candidatus Auribacterota bacterium]|uniref:Uncharacterized protein n=1 Tax=Candidatus Auribacter fodinae TaxID=2093366 RepID=A0A3A4REV8_9BACT|nr:MAG: hypothetical protein C4541_03190 [Candidatus Auribacter fodinae]
MTIGLLGMAVAVLVRRLRK